MSSISRRAHVLKPETSLAFPRQMVFFDTETYMQRLPNGDTAHTLRLGWACYWRRAYGRHVEREVWYEFRDCGSFWSWLLSHTEPKQKLWVIARNLSFDFSIVDGFSRLQDAGYKLRFFYGKGVTNIISVRKGSSSVVFLDSLNWFRETLAATGHRIGIEKGHVDFATVGDDELSRYCKRDVLIEFVNFKRFVSFLDNHTIGRLCYTKGSCAMSAYLLRHYHVPIYIHNNREAIEVERESYRGGRVECFFIGRPGKGPYYIVDVNSLYPYVMQEHEYPVKYVRQIYRTSSEKAAKLLKQYSVVARCIIETKDPIYAVKKGRTIFPIGRFRAVLCSPELDYACTRGELVRIDHGVVYEKANIFRSFVETFYRLRLEFKAAGNTEYQEFCKYIMNTLYGKFGQMAETWTKIGDCPNERNRTEYMIDLPTRTMSRVRYLLGSLEILTRTEESFDSFPAIASHVTAYGRMVLWSMMQQAGKGHYYYCDTDSLIVDKVGFENLEARLSETELGWLKLEQRTRELEIHGLKDYSTDAKTVIKGIRKTATRLEPGVYEQEQWPSLSGRLRKGDDGPYIVKKVVKHLNREYLKGTVTASGWVEPYVYSDEV